MRDDDDFIDDDGYPQREARPAARGWRQAAGAAVSLGLLGGLVVWTYQLGARDAAEVPVIRAMEGALKLRPEDPGGERFAHQDRAVYGVIDPRASADAVADAPAPHETIADEDLPAGRLVAPTRVAALEDAAAPPAPTVAAALRADMAAAALPAEALPAVVASPPPAVAAGPVGASEVDLLVAMVLDETAAEASPSVADSAPGPHAPRSSPPAPPRPAFRAAARPTLAPAASAVRIEPETPRAIPVSTAPAAAPSAPHVAPRVAPAEPQLQLGAYLSEADAMRMWSAIRARNGDLMAGREPAVAPIERDGRTLWLLRAGGFERASDAAALCGALAARGEECFVVRGG